MAKRNVVGAKGARLLRRVARHILAEPLRYEQDTIVTTGDPALDTFQKRKFPACGTVACIGGWLEILGKKVRLPGDHLSFGWGQKKLGVTKHQYGSLVQYTHRVHDEDHWPAKFRFAYHKAITPRQKARIAQRRIEHFIKTGE